MPAEEAMSPLHEGVALQTSGLYKAFGGLTAVKNISFAVYEGEIRAIIGPNGAGKTTLYDLLTGIYKPDAGRIFFAGKDITGLPSHRITAMGMARTFQTVRLFPHMSVMENVMVAMHHRTHCGFLSCALALPPSRREEAWMREEAHRFLHIVGLEMQGESLAGNLPFGQQRLLELARALATQPKVLLLDEPAAGLNAYETRELGDIIYRLRDMGITVILVEHDMGVVMRISEKVMVLDYGEIISEGTPEEVRSDPRVIEAYLGSVVD